MDLALKFTVMTLLGTVLLCSGCSRNQMSDKEYTERMAREHAQDAPVPGAASMETSGVDVTNEQVTYATVEGKSVEGYLARPKQGETTSGIIVIHEWWGLNDNIRTMTDKLAGQGYVALAVDLYGGRSADDPQQAQQLMQAAMQDPSAADSNLRQAYQFLTEKQGIKKVGTIGWCFGGGWSLNTAILLGDKIDATVVYYGRPVTDSDQLEKIQTPILGLYGAEDTGIPVEQVREMESELKALGKTVDIHVYPGASHAFANPSGNRYQPAAAKDAWTRTVAFFKQYLGT
jgi:carboxymethylenebutenolidase